MQMARFFKKHMWGYLFLLPFALLFSVFVILPVLVSFFTSFTNYNMFQPAEPIGLVNYYNLLANDDVFIIAMKNTLVFVCITGPIGYILSFTTAYVLNKMKMRNFFSLLFYTPSLTSSVAMATVWMYFFSSDRYGLINHVLLKIGAITEPVLWTMDTGTILPVIIIISIWTSMGTGFLVFVAGLQNLSPEILEAGYIDGVKSSMQELYYIVLPQMKPQLLFGIINAIVNAFGVFDISVTVAGMPSAQYAGHTIVTHLYDYAFMRYQMGYASAIAMVLFLITFLLGRIAFHLFGKSDQA